MQAYRGPKRLLGTKFAEAEWRDILPRSVASNGKDASILIEVKKPSKGATTDQNKREKLLAMGVCLCNMSHSPGQRDRDSYFVVPVQEGRATIRREKFPELPSTTGGIEFDLMPCAPNECRHAAYFQSTGGRIDSATVHAAWWNARYLPGMYRSQPNVWYWLGHKRSNGASSRGLATNKMVTNPREKIPGSLSIIRRLSKDLKGFGYRVFPQSEIPCRKYCIGRSVLQ